MRKLSMLLCLILVPASLTIGACDGDDDDDDDDNGDVAITDVGDIAEDDADEMDVEEPDMGEPDADQPDGDAMADPCADEGICDLSGTLTLHPVTQELDSEANVGGASLSAVSAATALAAMDGPPDPLETEEGDPAVQTFATSLMEAMTSWSFENVDVSGIVTGVVALVQDSEEVSEAKFVPAATGLAGGKPASNITDATVYAMTLDTEGQLANLVADASTGDTIQGPGDLLEEGFVLLQFVDEEGAPVSGVTVTSEGHDIGNESENMTGNRVEEAYYPNSDYSSATQGPFATTSETGIAILPGAELTTYGGVEVSSEQQFSLEQAGSNEGFAFFGVRAPVEQ